LEKAVHSLKYVQFIVRFFVSTYFEDGVNITATADELNVAKFIVCYRKINCELCAFTQLATY
jgi:hypothetical protein